MKARTRAKLASGSQSRDRKICLLKVLTTGLHLVSQVYAALKPCLQKITFLQSIFYLFWGGWLVFKVQDFDTRDWGFVFHVWLALRHQNILVKGELCHTCWSAKT